MSRTSPENIGSWEGYNPHRDHGLVAPSADPCSARENCKFRLSFLRNVPPIFSQLPLDLVFLPMIFGLLTVVKIDFYIQYDEEGLHVTGFAIKFLTSKSSPL
jgi:hypothetical protein